MAERRNAWVREQEERVAQAQKQLSTAVDKYLSARRKLRGELAMIGFLQNFPARGFSAGDGMLDTLKAPNGSGFDWAAVEAALREDAAPARPKPEPGVAVPLRVAS